LSLIRKTRGRTFCLLFNLRALLRGVDVSIRYEAGSRKLRARSGKYELCFYHEAQAYYASKRGFPRRARLLGESYFLPLIRFEPGDVVVDCGANVGELKLYFLENDIPVEYIGIEPSPLEYECLRENVAPSQTHNLGLWNTDGELDFFVSSQMADSSLIEPPKYDRIIKVPTRRLDGLLLGRRIKLLKVEAEGAEPEVLYGCEKLLADIDYISADVGFERGVEQKNTMAPVTNYLLANGFELVDVGQRRLTALFKRRGLPGPTRVRS
jgi:FkbM family methyltransferase